MFKWSWAQLQQRPKNKVKQKTAQTKQMDEISGRIGAIHPIDKGLNPLPKKSGPIGNRAFSQCSLPCQTISDSANFQSPFFYPRNKISITVSSFFIRRRYLQSCRITPKRTSETRGNKRASLFTQGKPLKKDSRMTKERALTKHEA